MHWQRSQDECQEGSRARTLTVVVGTLWRSWFGTWVHCVGLRPASTTCSAQHCFQKTDWRLARLADTNIGRGGVVVVWVCCYERARGNETPPPRTVAAAALPYWNRPYNVVSALAAEDKWLNSYICIAVPCVALRKIMDPPCECVLADDVQVVRHKLV